MANQLLTIRQACLDDLDHIKDIYNHFVKTSTCTMDLEEKTHEDMVKWLATHKTRYPAYVGLVNDNIMGVGSLSKWAERKGYDFSCEISLYLSPDKTAQGYGEFFLRWLLDAASKNGFTTIISFITSTNTPAIRLLIKNHFMFVGRMKKVGYKFNHVIDLDIYQYVIATNHR